MSNSRSGKNESPEQKHVALRAIINELTKAIESNPKDASAFLNRGFAYHQQGNYDQAVGDYNQAIRLKPEFAENINSYLHEALSRSNAKFNKDILPVGNSLDKIPDAVLVNSQDSFLNLADLNSLSQTSHKNASLFKPALALKKLLNLVVRYELNEKKIKDAIAKGVNPILQEVDTLLMKDQDVILALKRGHTSDHSGRTKYWSPLEAAYWSGNWELCNRMIARTQAAGLGAEAERQLRAWDEQAYHYDLILMRVEADAFPDLKKLEKPALIKQYKDGEDSIIQWGDVNGEWQATEFQGETKELFVNLDFPSNIHKPITMTSDQITKEMYDALKKGHTVAHFDLDEYVRVTDAFTKKYHANVRVPQEKWDESYTDSYKIGHTQKKFPAWLAAVWCSTIPFDPLPDVKRLIALPDIRRLNLPSGVDFFDAGLGKDFSIFKAADVATKFIGFRYAGMAECDLEVMTALCKVISDELDKSMQLLSNESKLTPGNSSP